MAYGLTRITELLQPVATTPAGIMSKPQPCPRSNTPPLVAGICAPLFHACGITTMRHFVQLLQDHVMLAATTPTLCCMHLQTLGVSRLQPSVPCAARIARKMYMSACKHSSLGEPHNSMHCMHRNKLPGTSDLQEQRDASTQARRAAAVEGWLLLSLIYC